MMRLWILGFFLTLIAVFSYLISNETDNLALIEKTDEQSRYTLFDSQSFVLPEPTKITNKDKTTTEVFAEKAVAEAYLNAKKDNISYIAYGKDIYLKLSASYGFVALFFAGIGSFVGYWFRKPIDGYDFTALRARTKQEIDLSREETRKAQETAQNAQIEALEQARAEFEHEKKQAEYQRQEAEKERRAAIQAQQASQIQIKHAKEQIIKANQEIETYRTKAEIAEKRMANAQNAALRRKNQLIKFKKIPSA